MNLLKQRPGQWTLVQFFIWVFVAVMVIEVVDMFTGLQRKTHAWLHKMLQRGHT